MMMENPSPTFGMSQALRFDPAWPLAMRKEAVLLMLECGVDEHDVADRCGIGADGLRHLLTTRVKPIAPSRADAAWHPDDVDDLTAPARRCLRLIGSRHRADDPIGSVRQAAAALQIPPGTMTRLLAQLGRNGLVQRSGARERAGVYSLTDAGVRILLEGAE